MLWKFFNFYLRLGPREFSFSRFFSIDSEPPHSPNEAVPWSTCLRKASRTLDKHFEKLQFLDGSKWGANQFAGHVTVISFTDQKSQEVSAKVGSALGKRFMDNPKFQIATAVKVPSMFKGLAGALLKSGQAKARESAVKRFEKDGQPVPDRLADRIHVVFDLDGKCSKESLSEWKDGQARIVLVDSDGKQIAESSSSDPNEAVENLAPKIEELLG